MFSLRIELVDVHLPQVVAGGAASVCPTLLVLLARPEPVRVAFVLGRHHLHAAMRSSTDWNSRSTSSVPSDEWPSGVDAPAAPGTAPSTTMIS